MTYTINDSFVDTTPGNPIVPSTLDDPLSGTVAPLPSFNDFNPNNGAINNALAENAVNDDASINTTDTSCVAPTTFTTGPDDKLKVVDAYAVKTSGTNNSLQGVFKSDPSMFGFLSNPIAEVNAIVAANTLINILGKPGLKAALLNQRNVIALIGATFPGALKAAFSQMSPSMISSMNITQRSNGSSVMINGQYQTVNNRTKRADAGDINAIVNTLSYLTGTQPLTNLNNANLINLSVGLVNTSVQYGLTGVFTALCGGDMLSGSILGAVVSQLLLPIVDGSLINLLYEVTNGNNGKYIPLVTSSFPAFLQRFVIGYKTPPGLTNLELIAQWDLMVECFNKIDPTWLGYYRNGEYIVNAELITWFSNDLLKIMKLAYANLSSITPNLTVLNNTAPYSIPDNNYRVLLLAMNIPKPCIKTTIYLIL